MKTTFSKRRGLFVQNLHRQWVDWRHGKVYWDKKRS
jgi:hypothetical protein